MLHSAGIEMVIAWIESDNWRVIGINFSAGVRAETGVTRTKG